MANNRQWCWLIVFSFALFSTGATTGIAAVPGMISYQGEINDDHGEPYNGTLDIGFLLYNAPTGGTVLWSEQQSVLVTDGIYNIQLGAITPLVSDVFSGNTVYLEVAIYNTVAASWEILSPRQRLTSMGYAFQAENSQTLEGFGSMDFSLNNHTHAGGDITTGTVDETHIDPDIARDVEINWSNLTGIPKDIADGDDVGVQTETDPTVDPLVKDGVSWTEIAARPPGLDDGDDVGITGSILSNRVPRWNGSSLVTGAIYDDGSKDISFDGSISVNGDIMGNQNQGRLVLKPSSHNLDYGIKFDNTYLGIFMGDDTEAQHFNFFTDFSSTRQYDAHLKVFGRATGSWGRYMELTHDGGNGWIKTDAGNINLEPGNDGVFSVTGDRDDSSIIATFRNNSDTKWTAIDINGHGDQDSILYFSNDDATVWSLRSDLGISVQNIDKFHLNYHGRGGLDDRIWEIGATPYNFYMVMHGNISPSVDNEYDLGNTSRRWREVFSANGVSTSSDIRLKENVDDLYYGLEEVMSLRPVSFQWKKDEEGERQIGLIAQEVNLQVPEVVDIPESEEGSWGINYSALVPVLIKAIQDQQGQIDELKARIQELE